MTTDDASRMHIHLHDTTHHVQAPFPFLRRNRE